MQNNVFVNTLHKNFIFILAAMQICSSCSTCLIKGLNRLNSAYSSEKKTLWTDKKKKYIAFFHVIFTFCVKVLQNICSNELHENTPLVCKGLKAQAN